MADGTRTIDLPEVEAIDSLLGHRSIDNVETLVQITVEDLATQIGSGGGGGTTDATRGVLEESTLRQRLMCSLLTGYNDGVTNTEIFSGAGRAPQGSAICTHLGTRRVFTLQRASGTTYGEDERHRIVEWAYVDDASGLTPVAWSGLLNVGHQGLSATVDDDDQVWLWTQHPIETGHSGLDAGKGLARIEWKGGSTTQSDVSSFQLFGYAGSGHAREYIVKASPAVSRDGSIVVFVSHDLSGDVDPVDPDLSDGGRTVTIYRMADILAATTPEEALAVLPVASWVHPGFRDFDDHINQAAAVDSDFIYTISGWTNPFGWHTVYQLDHHGNLIAKVRAAFNRAAYGLDDLLEGVSGGTPVSFEPEGLMFDDDGALLVLLHEGWNTDPDIVTYEGGTFSALKASTGVSPLNGRYWARTAQSAGGAWDAGTTYSPGTLKRRAQQIYRLAAGTNHANDRHLSAGVYSRAPASAIHAPISPVDFSYEDGFDFTIAAWNLNTGAYRRMFQCIWDSGSYRFFDMRNGGSQSSYGAVTVQHSSGRGMAGMRGDRNQSNGAWANFYANTDSDFAYQIRMGRGGDTTGSIVVNSANNVRPAYDGTQNLGAADYQWDNIYLVSNPIVSSDARLKTAVAPLSVAEIAAARDLAAEIGTYQWLSAIEDKGIENARHHAGMTVQRAIEIMEGHGLNPWRYGFICKDEWDGHADRFDHIPAVKELRIAGQVIVEAEEAQAILVEPAREDGELLSFRLDQLALFIARGMAARQDDIEARLTALETA